MFEENKPLSAMSNREVAENVLVDLALNANDDSVRLVAAQTLLDT